jgi:hypothetical protein
MSATRPARPSTTFARAAALACAAAFACAAALGCAASPAPSTSGTDTGSGQGVCNTPAAGLCVAYPGDTAAQRTACTQASGTYQAPSVCMPAGRVGTCACADAGQGLGPATFSLYAPTYACATAKATCAQMCNGRAGTFTGGC